MTDYSMAMQYRVKQLLNYDPDTGVFTWLVSNGRRKSGSVAGSFESNGYLQIKIDGIQYMAHRIAWIYMYGCWPDGMLDHKDRNKINNRIENLRIATPQQNQQNHGLSSRNKSGVKGVCWHKERGKWLAQINIGRKNIHIGRFDDLELAELVSSEARAKYFGEFA